MNAFNQPLAACALILGVLALLPGPVLAQTAPTFTDKVEQRVDKREQRQAERVAKGTASGQLTATEQARLAKEQTHINQMETRMEADGKVTRKEVRRMEKAQDRVSFDIAHQAHDRQRVRRK